ncbi:unnamed protein product [Choristocarpus tenellus]
MTSALHTISKGIRFSSSDVFVAISLIPLLFHTCIVKEPVEGMFYHWMVNPDRGEEFSLEGSTISTVFKALDWHTVKVDEVNLQGKITRSLEQRILSKYVRREIRRLTDEDTQALMDAMHILWTVKINAGKEIYGEDYLDIYTINELHQACCNWCSTYQSIGICTLGTQSKIVH